MTMNGMGGKVGISIWASRTLGLSVLLVSLRLWTGLCAAQDPPAWSGAQSEVFVAKPASREVILTGYTRARQRLKIVSEAAGRCIRVVADVGDTIGEDGLFAVLDSTFVKLALKKKRLEQRRVERAIAYDVKEVNRYRVLVKRDSMAQSVLDDLENRLDQNRIRLEALKVEAKELKERLARHTIRVPSGWTLVNRSLEPGQWVPSGAVVGQVGNFQHLLVPFALSSQELTALETLEGIPRLFFPAVGKTVPAPVERISPAFDATTRKTQVDLLVRGGLSPMRGGLQAELTIQVPDSSGAVWVPIRAVSERYEEFRLIRENGEEIPVVLLDKGSHGLARVQSPDVRPGDRFRVTLQDDRP